MLFALVPAVEIVGVVPVEGAVVSGIFWRFFAMPLNYSDVAERETSLWDDYKQAASITREPSEQNACRKQSMHRSDRTYKFPNCTYTAQALANMYCSKVKYTKILPKKQVEGEPMVYWKGMPVTFTTCDYDLDKITTMLRQRFCMGMPPNMLPQTLTEMRFRVQLGDQRG